MKTVVIVQADGTSTTSKSSHSFGCVTVFATFLLVYACVTLPILLVPTVVLAAMFTINYRRNSK